MPGEMVLLPLGVAVARLLLHANAGSDAATLLGDAKDGWTALKKLRNRPRGLNERLLGPDHPDTLTSRNNLAIAYRAVGRDGEADGLETNT